MMMLKGHPSPFASMYIEKIAIVPMNLVYEIN